MGHHSRRESFAGSTSTFRLDLEPEPTDLLWPFGNIDGLDRDDIRETAYEIFFTACRSSPGFGGRNALNYYSSNQENTDGGSGTGPGFGSGAPNRGNGVGLLGTSRMKRVLGLKTLRRSTSRRTSSVGGGGSSNPSSPGGHGHGTFGSNPGSSPSMSFTVPPGKLKRPLTSAEIMRQQMRVTEQSDNRLRKTLMRTLVGQMGRRAETIILPLELLRHLKPSEFNDAHEYHLWQKRQLKILELGLLLHPSIPLDRSNTFAMRLRDIVRSSESKSIDTGKHSENMRALCNSVVSLAWRSPTGAQTDVCHWADGFPVNIHLYLALLHSIFDLRDETLVLDEIDEILELIKKTWSTLGISRAMHNLCFTWILFQQYVVTGQTEPDLLCASVAMLAEVVIDAKKSDREVLYVKMLSSVLTSIKGWSEKRLLDYHESFHKGTIGLMDNLLPLALSVTKILDEDVGGAAVSAPEERKLEPAVDSTGNRVDQYIRSSLKTAFTKVLETEDPNDKTGEIEQKAKESLFQLAKETEDLATKEKETFSPILKKWHPIATGLAAVTLHNCYGTVLKQFLAGVSTLTNETIEILQRAGKLEKVLVSMVVEDSVDYEDGGRAIVREMVPYEVDSIILSLLKTWIEERLKKARELFERAKETETWNPKSKTEPYAQSVVELMKLAKQTVDDFFEIPIRTSDDLVHDLAGRLELLFQDYTTFVASCGSKQSYIPTLPPLTRCNRDSKFIQLCKKASPCKIGTEDSHHNGSNEGNHPRPSTSRGTQRLYIRLNTLHYLLSHIHSIDKTLALSPRLSPSSTTKPTRFPHNRRQLGCGSSYFDLARSSIQAASQHVSEIAAYRLIFLDSNSVFYESLYMGDVANARIRPALRILKQNLTLLGAILTDRAQPLAIKEVMKASFEAYLMVLLAGGSSRVFYRSDHEMIEEDFDSLKRVFCACGEGFIAEEVVEREAETVEGVVTLMGQCTEQIMEDFSIVACEASGIGMVGSGQKLPMPPTTGRWNRSDPNTILRVLCHRNDGAANQFLKRTFQLAKRR